MPQVTRPNGTVLGEITDPQELAYYRSVGYRVADAPTKPAARSVIADSPAPSVPAETSLELDTDKENQE